MILWYNNGQGDRSFEKEPSMRPRYYKLELIQDNLIPYPIKVRAISEDMISIVLENGEEKDVSIDEWYFEQLIIEKGSGKLPKVEIKNHCIYVNGVCWAAENCYLYNSDY